LQFPILKSAGEAIQFQIQISNFEQCMGASTARTGPSSRGLSSPNAASFRAVRNAFPRAKTGASAG
jgi:hypothetical protein